VGALNRQHVKGLENNRVIPGDIAYINCSLIFYQSHQLIHLAVTQRKAPSICRDGTGVVRQECELTSYPHGTKVFRRESWGLDRESGRLSRVGARVKNPSSLTLHLHTIQGLAAEVRG
jgi:hypothetical protein